eukprot:Nk52_evm19s1073 gene=Nk52_evmTU19s1073
MFSGRWRDASEDVITIDILDDNIDQEALSKAFESLYHDDIDIQVPNLVQVLGAASMLQLEGLIGECVETMKSNIGWETVSEFYSCSNAYGQMSVAQECIKWLERHLCTSLEDKHLGKIPADFLEVVLKSPRLFVVHVELDVYVVVRKWVFLQLHPDALEKYSDVTAVSAAFFRGLEGSESFVERSEGQEYERLFRTLRLQHIINDVRNIQLLEKDNIIPQSWLLPVFRRNWEVMLNGGIHLSESFDEACLRCGRILHTDSQLTWRWTGFSYGFDVLLTYSKPGKLVSFKRNAKVYQSRFSNSSSFICMYPKRSLKFKLTVASFDEDGKELYFKSTDVQEYSFGINQEIVVMSIDDDAKFPLHFSLNMAFSSVQPEARSPS